MVQWQRLGLLVNWSNNQSCTRGMIDNKISCKLRLSPAQYSLTNAELWPKTPFLQTIARVSWNKVCLNINVTKYVPSLYNSIYMPHHLLSSWARHDNGSKWQRDANSWSANDHRREVCLFIKFFYLYADEKHQTSDVSCRVHQYHDSAERQVIILQ